MDNIENGIIYLGFNNPLKYKRGVENVILFQSEALKWDHPQVTEKDQKYYISEYYKYKDEKPITNKD